MSEMTEKATEPGAYSNTNVYSNTYSPDVPRYKVLVASSRRIQSNYGQILKLAKMVGAKIMDEENWILLNNGESETTSEGIVSIARLVCGNTKCVTLR